MVRSMMVQANLPILYWGDALLTVAYIHNYVPTNSVISTPYELWTGQKPKLGHFLPWGLAAYVHDPSSKYEKSKRQKVYLYKIFRTLQRVCVYW